MNSDELVSAVADMFRRAHRDACYPDCLDVQASGFARAIIPLVLEHAAKVVDARRSSGENTDEWTITRDKAFHDAVAAIRAEVQHDAG